MATNIGAREEMFMQLMIPEPIGRLQSISPFSSPTEVFLRRLRYQVPAQELSLDFPQASRFTAQSMAHLQFRVLD